MPQTSENYMLIFLKECTRVLLKGKIPDLLAFRYFKKWSELIHKNPLSEKQPWITFKAIDFITKNTGKNDKVFEYGGGGSTLYFLSKVNEVVTVEHDHEWFYMLQKEIDPADSVRWRGQLILPEKTIDTTNLDKSRPADYYSSDPTFRNATFHAYCTFICQFKDEYFDLILIDGRARTSCLFHAIPKVKIGGFLVLDNAERKYYLQNNMVMLKKNYRLLINQMGPVPYSPNFSQTAIWQKVK